MVWLEGKRKVIGIFWFFGFFGAARGFRGFGKPNPVGTAGFNYRHRSFSGRAHQIASHQYGTEKIEEIR